MTTLIEAKSAGTIASINSKMPGSSYSLPTSKCHAGVKLSKVEGSVCFDCYAKTSERMYASVRQSWGDNWEKAVRMIKLDSERWSKFIAFQITNEAKKNDDKHHRWFAAGDLNDVAMLRAIVRVCELTPHVRHWLPTRESKIITDWRKAGGVEPANLVIRLSSTMVGDGPRKAPHTSTVHAKGQAPFGHSCPSTSAENRAMANGKPNCGKCRACWDKSVPNVSYPIH